MRECGTCSACCRWPSIPELKKPAGISCKHIINNKFGCNIYETRPKTCSKYFCTWKRGYGDKEDQPNVCHVLIDMKYTKWGRILVAKSLRPNAVRSRRGMVAIQRIAASRDALCFIVADDDPVRIIGMAGPRELLDVFRKKHGQPMEILPPDKLGLDMDKIMIDAMVQHKQFVAGIVGAG